MSAENTLNSLKQFCKANSGDEQIWQGNTGTYYWNRGKTTTDSIVNGVVRKLVGTDVSGSKIWAVAGSFKLSPTGAILRFTGLPKKLQKELAAPIAVDTVSAVTTVNA